MRAKLSEQMAATVKDAATKLTGREKRAFQARVALDYLEGSARRAEAVLGWGREAVGKGLEELRHLPDEANAEHERAETRGRRKSEQRLVRLEEDLRERETCQSAGR